MAKGSKRIGFYQLDFPPNNLANIVTPRKCLLAHPYFVSAKQICHLFLGPDAEGALQLSVWTGLGQRVRVLGTKVPSHGVEHIAVHVLDNVVDGLAEPLVLGRLKRLQQKERRRRIGNSVTPPTPNENQQRETQIQLLRAFYQWRATGEKFLLSLSLSLSVCSSLIPLGSDSWQLLTNAAQQDVIQYGGQGWFQIKLQKAQKLLLTFV
jgi:hypothetical protein